MRLNTRIGAGWEDVTPPALRCGIGACPGIYKTPTGSYVVIGRTLSGDEMDAALPNRVGHHETAIEIDAAFIDGIADRR